MISKGASDLNEGLIGACNNNNLELAKLMIDKGANNFNDALDYIEGKMYIDIIKLLVEKGANNLNSLHNIENLELYKLYLKNNGENINDHYKKLVIFYDPVYYLITHKELSKIEPLPMDLLRMLKDFI